MPSLETMRAEYARLKDEIATLVAGCEEPEQAMWEMIRKAAQLAASADIPLHTITAQLRDEYALHKIDQTGHDGLN